MWRSLILAFAFVSGSLLLDVSRTRNQIVPLVAAHQHLLGPGSVPERESSLPPVKLPQDLTSIVEERARLAGSPEPSNLFTDNAVLLKSDDATWVRGRSDIQMYIGTLDKGASYSANAF